MPTPTIISRDDGPRRLPGARYTATLGHARIGTTHLLKNVLALAHPLGLILIGFAATFLLPLLLAGIREDHTAWAFVLPMIGTCLLGVLLSVGGRRFRRELKPRDGYLLVALVWIVLAACAAGPLLLAIPGLSFTDAFFEAMSGFTTTGATVLTGLDHLAEPLNLWRAELNWLGGLGIIGLAMAVLPLLGIGGMQIYRAEATGPIKDTKLTPRLVQTARSLWLIYTGLTLACILALKLVGMGWFDAVCHAFAALSLGGFSTHDASVGYFDSPAIELVLEVFMILAAINFATHYAAWRSRSLRSYFRDPEARTLVGLILASVLAGAIYLRFEDVYQNFYVALRNVGFNLVSIATDCGFVSVDYGRWPLIVPLWMLLLSCLTASAGSTGGGIKMMRTLILVRQSGREMAGLLHPNGIATVKLGGVAIPERRVSAVLGFIHLYTFSVVAMTLVLVLSGMGFVSAFSAIVATINNAGPGLNAVGPASTYAGLTDFQTWVCTFSMLLGRLEIFVLLVPLTPAFWRG
jgi:Trk-type K+ transport systems, membrane components